MREGSLAFEVIRWAVRAGALSVAVGALVSFVHAGRRTTRRGVVVQPCDAAGAGVALSAAGELGEGRQAPVDRRQAGGHQGGVRARERLGAEEPVVRRER